MRSPVLCVAAGQFLTRKKDNPVARKNLYLNYGLLSVASHLKRMGLDACQVQGNFDSPEKTLEKCVRLGLINGKPIFLSIPTFYALDWARCFVRLLKREVKGQRFVIGGRWTIGGRPERLREFLDEGDVVVQGLGEHQLMKICAETLGMKGVGNEKYIFNECGIDYSILHERELYQPSIEIARGCGMGCSFCQEKDEPLSNLKPAELLLKEMARTVIRDDLVPMTPYLEASVFMPGRRWVGELCDTMSRFPVQTEWRTEARVDSMNPDLLEDLFACGMRVLDIGLESADQLQLARMNKTKNPDIYLKRASLLLRRAKEVGVLVKVNVLLFAGESMQSVSRTTEWLDAHRDCIAGISAGPVVCYGWPEDSASYVRKLSEFGAKPSRNQKVMGAIHMDLSPDMDYDRALEVSKNISDHFMTPEMNYYLKSFSYFPRNYTREQFMEDRKVVCM